MLVVGSGSSDVVQREVLNCGASSTGAQEDLR